MASPTSTLERIKGSAELSTGFIYAVSRTGVTGESSDLSVEAAGLVQNCKKWAKCSVLLGFGLSNAEQIRAAGEVSDGAIVGSALVRWLAENWKGAESQVNLLEFCQTLVPTN